MGKVVDALIDGTPLGKLAWDAIGVDAWWEVGVGKYVREALIPIPDDDFGNEAMSQQQMLRSPTEARRSIYGKAMVSGPIVFAAETGTDNEYLHLVIPLAAHQCAAVLEIYFDDEVVYQNGSLDAAYSEHARINIHLGGQTTADSDLQAECEHWTASHIGLGVTYLYVRLKHDPEFYANGLPNIKALVQGKPLYDPRKDSTVGGSGSHRWDDESTWEWSDNWALCVLDYTRFESGVGALSNEIDLPSYALAANDSDQLVEYDDEGNTEKRYTCNGTFTQSMTPASVLDKLLTAGAGMQTYSSGKYQLFSGVYQGPHLLTIGEADLAGEVEVRPFNARAQLCNAVRGTFVDPDNFYQPTDFAPYESDYYRAQDNGEYIDHDIDLPFTQSAYTAQRLAKLYLELNRAGQQIVVPLNMIGLSVSVGQVIELDLPRLGIKAEYQVMDWQFDFGQPIKVTLRETAPALFDYDKGSYTDRKLTPVLNLPSSKRVPTVTGVVWTPMGDDANWQGLLSWNAPGGNSAYRYRLEVSDGLNVVYQATIDATQHHIPKLDAGNYTITLWAVNLFANRSNVPATIAIGADVPPAVTGILVDAGALELTLRPQTAAITATTTEFEVKGGLSSDIANAQFIGQGKEVIWPGRHANTQYFVWARATNNFGTSAWFGPIIAQTTSDKSALVDLLGTTFDKYTWFAWADDNQGTGFTTDEAIGDGKAYLGQAVNKDTASPSGNWQDYTWSKIQTEIPELFTPEEEAALDNLMAGKLPAGDKDMLALQDALNDPKFNNNLLTAQQLLNQGIDAADLGGETPAGAQAKANAAEAAAALDALNKANAVKTAVDRESSDFFFDNGFLGLSLYFQGPPELLDSVVETGSQQVVNEGEHGGKALRVTGTKGFYTVPAFPVDVNKRYKVRFKVRQFDNGIGGRQAYAGVATLDKNLNNITGGAGSHRYCAASGATIDSSQGWRVFEGYIEGVGDGHKNFRPGTAYVRPMCIVNYNGGSGTADIDELSFHEVTEQGDLIAIGMETSVDAQAKADAAQALAESYATAKANLAELQAKAYADGIVSDEEARAIADAQAKADNAKNAAIYATSSVTLYGQGEVSVLGNTVVRTPIATSDWAAGAYSKEVYTGGAVASAVIDSGTPGGIRFMFGLNTDPDSSASYVTIDYALYANNDYYGCYESGVSRGVIHSVAPAIGDVVSVAYDGVNVIYMVNGVIVRTVAAASNKTFALDMSFVNAVCGLKGIQLTPMSNLNTAALDATTKANSAKSDAVADMAAGNFTAQTALISTLLASSALFNQLKARIGAFNGLTAETIAALAVATDHLQAGAVTSDKVTADTALINKLVASQGLFDALQARFGVFGGLAAQSIAAKAITVDKLDVLSKNLVNNFSVSGESRGWDSFPLVDHVHKGKTIKAFEVKSSGNTAGTCSWFEIDHTKIYEVNFTIHRVSGGSTGSRYFGMIANGDGYVTPINPETRNSGASNNNFYFWSGDIADGQYRQMRGYIIGSEVDPASIPDSLNVSLCCQLNPSTTKVYLRALNYYNAGVETIDRWLNPSVSELGGGQISANQLLANSGLFNQLKAKIGSFGGLTASELQVDTALINKLVGTSALFNDLVARLAVFGGLTANSIAAGAILGTHIKAGEKIQSPIIEGGQSREISGNSMTVRDPAGFGPDNLIEWFGPKKLVNGEPDWANLTKANGSIWKDYSGSAYFGGSLSAGVLKTGVTNPDKNQYAVGAIPVQIGPFGTNGNSKNVVFSYSLFAKSTTSSSTTISNKSISWQLERAIGNGSWVVVASGTFTIAVSKHWEPEFSYYRVTESSDGSYTFTDNSTSTSDFQYRVKILSATRYHVVSDVTRQELTLISTEQ